MAWYNPLHWFEKQQEIKNEQTDPDMELKLYCGNPQCKDPIIREDHLAYNPDEKEICHRGECQSLAMVHRMWLNPGTRDHPNILYANYEFINRKEAFQLIRKGQIKQPDLESKLTE